MVLPGHLAGGYLATQAVLALTGSAHLLSPNEYSAIIVFGTLAGEMPDMDLFFYYFNQKKIEEEKKIDSHRSYLTHAPLFWLVISLAIVGLGTLVQSAFTATIGWVLLAGTWSHFLLDSFEYGIRWLWPFTNRRFYAIHVVEPEIEGQKGTIGWYWKLIKRVYFKRLTFYLEIAVVLVAIWVAFQ